VLTGVSADDPLSTRAARMEIYRRFMQALDSTGEHLTDSLSEVDVSNPEDVKALVPSGSSDILVHFGQEEFLKRYREFQQHLPEWKQKYPKLASADMRYEGQIVLEMQGGGGAAPAGSGSASGPAANADAVAARPAPVAATPPASVRPPSVQPPSVQSAKPKLVAAKATKPAAKKTVANKPVANKKAAAGQSAANQKEFAALAAAHKAALTRVALAKTTKSGGANGAGGATP
jgi:cell division protein FtsQ